MQAAFLIRAHGKLQFIPFDDVLYIIAKNNYSEIVTVSKKKWLIYATLGYMQQKLPDNLFCRTHRSYIISLKKIECLDHNSVEIAKQKIPLSKTGFKEITKRVLVICPEFDKKNKIDLQVVSVKQYPEEVKDKKSA